MQSAGRRRRWARHLDWPNEADPCLRRTAEKQAGAHPATAVVIEEVSLVALAEALVKELAAMANLVWTLGAGY